MIEDFHAVRLVYRGHLCRDPPSRWCWTAAARTASARWVSLDDVAHAARWTANWRDDPAADAALGSTTRGRARRRLHRSVDVAEQVLPGQHADRLAVVQHQQGIAVDQHLDRLGHRLGRARPWAARPPSPR